MDLRRDLAMLVSTSAAVAAANHATTLAREIQHLQRRIAEIGQQISDSEPGLGVALLRSGLDAEEMLGALLDVKKLSNRLALTLQSLVVDKQQGEYPTRTNLDVEVQRMPADVQWRTALIHKAVSIFEESGLGEALSFMWTNGHPHEYTIYTEELADALSLSHPESCVAAYLVAYGMNALPARAVKIAARLFKAGNLTEARRLIDVGGDVTDSAFLGELRLATALARDGLPLPQRRRCTFATVDGLAYVASSSQPFTISGYTTRTQQLLTALVEEGGTVTCYTRPGYPWDRPGLIKEGTTVPEHQVVSNIKYVHTYVPGIATSGESFITSMASALIERFKEHPPRIVQAASNNRNALPALLASRTLGLPFVYEVRGLWELTAASRIHGWENTERYELDRHLETLIAQEADLVLTITEAVADELREGGVTHDRIRILANGVDPDEFHPLPKDEELVQLFDLKPEELILVYAGSLLVYEGLDDVIEAVCILRDRGLSARLFILGDGPYRGELEAKALQCRAGTNVRFLGRVRPDEVSRYLSLADVVPITRKPFRVCEVVSPLKPFEAMAMGKAVVLTDLKALREIVVDKQRGRLCRPADPTHLADVLSELTLDRDECARLGMAGRDWVINHRSWRAHARSLLSYHKEIVA
jgi:glycosyltransferase involved in cell wall biosynthesis